MLKVIKQTNRKIKIELEREYYKSKELSGNLSTTFLRNIICACQMIFFLIWKGCFRIWDVAKMKMIYLLFDIYKECDII